ncbi:MAG: hypothetical protein ACOCVF_00560 [bacterium]
MAKRIKGANQYFGEKEEQAVVDYINSNSAEEKNEIYNNILKEPFQKMIQSILRKYPIHIGYYDIEEVEENALTHLIEHMVKFNPDKITKSGNKTRAFSYCQTIVRNYYKDHSVRSYLERKSNLSFDDYFDEANDSEYSEEYGSDEDYLDELILIIIKEISKIINSEEVKKNEIIVGNAIINILENWEILFSENSPHGKYNKKITNKYAKNKILLFLKEQTGLNTKEIRQSIKPFKEIYFLKKMEFYEQ